MTVRPLPRRRFALLLALSAGALTVPSTPAMAGRWNSNNIEGNGRIKTESRAVAGFHGVSMALPGSVELRIGATESLTIETDDNLLPLIETVVENGTLQIRPNKRNLGLNSRHMKLVVQARSIDRLALGGSGRISADALKGSNVTIDLGGSGNIDVKNIDAASLSVDLGGSGELKVANGRAGKLSVSIAGSGNVDLGRLQSTSASASIAGSGDATFAVRDNLDVSIVGSGNVTYSGNPRVSRSVMGSGTIKQK
ncbi:MAG: hypothetical protein JWP59_602 [Massilia sp.]|nr:hypothetical protein [Massilia sp.]